MPLLKNIQLTKGGTVREVLVPFTDGKKQIGVSVNLEKCISNEGKELIKSMEKMIALAIIDQTWKEHLRDMDDLKQSVQNAVYEQKDPLLIYKFEAFELFKVFLGKVNEETISFLVKASIAVQDSSEVHEARKTKKSQKYDTKKDDHGSLLAGRRPETNESRPPVEKVTPRQSQKIVGRNERVSVQYADGTVKKDVKFKTVEEDVKNEKCIIIEN